MKICQSKQEFRKFQINQQTRRFVDVESNIGNEERRNTHNNIRFQFLTPLVHQAIDSLAVWIACDRETFIDGDNFSGRHSSVRLLETLQSSETKQIQTKVLTLCSSPHEFFKSKLTTAHAPKSLLSTHYNLSNRV